MTEQEILQEKLLLTKTYLRRALEHLLKSKELFDIENDDSDEQEEKITNFIAEVKRKRLV